MKFAERATESELSDPSEKKIKQNHLCKSARSLY